MARKTFEERIAALKEQEARLKAQERALLARHLQKERKARSKRLFEVGTAIETILGHLPDDDELEAVLEYVRDLSDTPATQEYEAVGTRVITDDMENCSETENVIHGDVDLDLIHPDFHPRY